MSAKSEESAGWIEFLTWLEIHKQKLLLGGVGILLAGAALYVAKWTSDQKEQAGSMALYKLQSKSRLSGGEKEPSAKDFLKISEAYMGTRAGERVLLLAARAYFVAGRFDQAREQFERFQTLYDSSAFLSTALYGVAASWDAAGKLDEAKNVYQVVLKRFANTPLAAQAKLAIAGIYEAQNKPKEALALYEELNRPGIPPSYSGRAAFQRQNILKEHPELQPKPADTDALNAQPGPAAALPAPVVKDAESSADTATDETSEEAPATAIAQPEPNEQAESGDP